ncbi:MATE family efflux transporter [Antarcticimicrobium sediminis]|uniref:Multidrug export protein MepA n=1 Tax=Antarcticimicrobium sediminis TaxID=2546227 RepID=A0A4R5EM00_9RHOB|nr:MATE family efflux transporter [Antarcticimicrobium sediminis]TDE35598.1 MATE family efflux transporter [Antarcticimicrobium sediminis]
MSELARNSFLEGSLPAIYAKTALPIIFVMGMSGLLSVADAVFLGVYVGPRALAAVTLMFPIYMVIVALATLVGSGMSSLLARHLGAGQMEQARATLAGAHGLALALGIGLIALFALIGGFVASRAAGGAGDLADMGLAYLRIMVAFSPVMFVLSVQSDALRNEGKAGTMAAMSLLVTLANIALNYLLIARLEMGVAGSALGTGLAQLLALAAILALRSSGRTLLPVDAMLRGGLCRGWRQLLALGAPQSLNFLGLALVSAALMAGLQIAAPPEYSTLVSAYGIITRIMTFVFLPVLGLSFAMQTITGNNFGAGLWQRSDRSVRIALGAALLYCGAMQLALSLGAAEIAGAFVDDPEVIGAVARILPVMTALFWLAGPLMLIASHFQALGDAARAAVLGLSKPYLFAIPLTLVLALSVGEAGIWFAGPIAELCLLALTAIVLARTARRRALRWGLFSARVEAGQ